MIRRVGLAWVVLAWVVLAGVVACSPQGAEPDDVDYELRIDPAPPVQGEVSLSLRVSDPDGPLGGARVEIEGNMSHAGMKPSFASLSEVEPGLYEGDFVFTMGGDWFLIVSVETGDGRSLRHVIEVPGVGSM